jgi:hypothetical protein
LLFIPHGRLRALFKLWFGRLDRQRLGFFRSGLIRPHFFIACFRRVDWWYLLHACLFRLFDCLRQPRLWGISQTFLQLVGMSYEWRAPCRLLEYEIAWGYGAND